MAQANLDGVDFEGVKLKVEVNFYYAVKPDCVHKYVMVGRETTYINGDVTLWS
jgi:hypothetical protein